MKTAKKHLFLRCLAIFLFFLATFFIITTGWMSKTFDQVAFEQLLFHIIVPVEGANPELVYDYLFHLGLVVGLTVVYGLLLFWLTRGKSKAGLTWAALLLVIPYLGLSLYMVEDNHGILAYYTKPSSTFIENNYAPLTPEQISFADNRHNLILILLESVEETFNDKQLFGRSLIPEIAALRARNLSFYGINQFLGCNYTIAAITSFFFGVPLKLPIDGNTYDSRTFAAFLPGAVSILEVLEQNGYQIDFFLGSRATFSGKDNLFATHTQHGRVHDLRHFGATRDDVGQHIHPTWGMPDYYVYARAKEFIQQNYSRQFEGNFFLIIETVDTHWPDGYVVKGYKQKWGDFRDSISASSKMAAEFVAWIRKQPFAKNTTIIVMGDHALMTPEIADIQLPEYPYRQIFNVFINPVPQIKPLAQQRRFASFDMAPTILESIGAQLPDGRFGLGVSLFNQQPTLNEQLGFEALSEKLQENSTFYDNFYRHNARGQRD